MIIYPAIDILDGEVVRLVKGDFNQKTVFFDDPLVALKEFEEQGATCLHLVDLSGAKDPEKRQLDLIENLVKNSALKIQVGGGIRSCDEISSLLDLGVDRVVIGSMAITNKKETEMAFEKLGSDRLTLALDIILNDGIPQIKTHGWTKNSGETFADVAQYFLKFGLKRVLCTDISVDGLLVGPNVKLYSELQSQFPELEIQASGGVEKLENLHDLKSINAHSVVIGRALLSKKFSLKEALQYA